MRTLCEVLQRECTKLEEHEECLREELFVMREESELYRDARSSNYTLAYRLNEDFQREAELGRRLEDFLVALVSKCPAPVRDMVLAQMAESKYISLEATQALVQDQKAQAERSQGQDVGSSGRLPAFVPPRSLSLQNRSLDPTQLPSLSELGDHLFPADSPEMQSLIRDAEEWKRQQPPSCVGTARLSVEEALQQKLQSSVQLLDASIPFLLLSQVFSKENRLIPLHPPLDERSCCDASSLDPTTARVLPSSPDRPPLFGLIISNSNFHEDYLSKCSDASLAAWLDSQLGDDGFPVAGLVLSSSSGGETSTATPLLLPSASFLTRHARRLVELRRFQASLPRPCPTPPASPPPPTTDNTEEEEEEEEEEEDASGMDIDDEE